MPLITDTGPPPERVACQRTGRTYQVGARLARTGRSTVYAVGPEAPPLAFKQYEPGTVAAEPHLESRIRAMIARPPAYRAGGTGHVWCAWPEDLAIVDGRFAGYLMPRVDTGGLVALPDLPARATTRAPAQARSGGSAWADHVLVAANLARAVALLHDGDVVVGDLRPEDVLVAPDRRVTLVGCDAMQVTDPHSGRTYPCRPDLHRLAPPELLAATGVSTLRPRSSDLFSLAVAVHLLLLAGEHPFDGEWRGPGVAPSTGWLAQNGLWCHAGDERLRPHPGDRLLTDLPTVLQDCFRKAFVDGARHPYDRPSARQWQEELTGLRDMLTSHARYPGTGVAAPPIGAPAPPARRPTPVDAPQPTLRDVDPPTLREGPPASASPPTSETGTALRQDRPATRRHGRPAALRLGVAVAVAALCIGGIGTATVLKGSAVGPGAPAVTTSPPAVPAPTTPVMSTAPAPSAAQPGGSAQALDRIRAEDARAAEGLVDAWVAQLATQLVGRSAAPSTAAPAGDDAALAAVLAGHRAVKRRYPDALLLWSADWNYDGSAWITVLGRRFATAQEANAWCDDQRLEPRRCFAKRLSRTGAVDGTVRYRG